MSDTESEFKPVTLYRDNEERTAESAVHYVRLNADGWLPKSTVAANDRATKRAEKAATKAATPATRAPRKRAAKATDTESVENTARPSE